jgi:hypothetical protein
MNVLRALKNKINTGKPVSADELFSKVGDYKVVSFDVFDTLLKRNVRSPKDVFYYMESFLAGKYEDFAENRMKAERTAREQSVHDEVTIQDIYSEYPKINKDEQEFLINYELQTESDLLMANRDIFPCFLYSYR